MEGKLYSKTIYQGNQEGKHGVRNHIIRATSKANQCNMDIVQVYAPQQGLSEEEKEDFVITFRTQ